MNINQSRVQSLVSTDDIESRILAMLVEMTGLTSDSISLHSSFESLGFDIYDRIELTMRIEDMYSIVIDDNQNAALTCAYDYIALIRTVVCV